MSRSIPTLSTIPLTVAGLISAENAEMPNVNDLDQDAELTFLLSKLFKSLSIDNITYLLNHSFPTTYPPTRVVSRVEAFEVAAPVGLLIDRIVTPIWYTIGLIGNPITMKIWFSKRMRQGNSSAVYIGTIAAVQLIFIFLHFFMELHIAWGLTTYNKPGVCEFFNLLYILPQYLCPLLILGFTVERYIAVCHPFIKGKVCTVRRACATVAVLIFITLCLGSVQAYIWTYDDKRQVCYFRPGSRRFVITWNWVSEMFIFAVVPLTVLLFNVLVIREVRQLTRRASYRINCAEKSSMQTSNHTSTVTLLSVSFYLICTLLPATLVYALQSLISPGDPTIPPELWSTDPTWRRYVAYYTIRKVVEEICFSNYACYVFIYYLTGLHFRNEVHKLFSWIVICKRKCSESHGSKQTPFPIQRDQHDDYTLVTTRGKTDVNVSSTAC